jgi:integrase
MRKSAPHVVRTEPAPDTEVDTHGQRWEYVTEDEVERLLRAASKHERGDRDALMILMASRHGLRVS